MQVLPLIDVLSRAAESHGREADTFERLADCGHDYLESSFGQKFHEGASEAYRTLITALRRVIDHDESISEAFAAALRDADDVELEPTKWLSESEPATAMNSVGPCIA